MRIGTRVGPVSVSASTKKGDGRITLAAIGIAFIIALAIVYWPVAIGVGAIAAIVAFLVWFGKR